MGNNICCEESRTHHGIVEHHEPEIIKHPIHVQPEKKVESLPPPPVSPPKEEQPPKETIPIPLLPFKVQNRIQEQKFFHSEIQAQKHPEVKRYGKDVYQGALDEFHLKPNGFGRMYKPDGSIYIGHFKSGKAEGKGAFIFADGSYYQGDFVNNSANSAKSEFVSDSLRYHGSFKNNTFDGDCQEEGADYKFNGTYANGVRTKGHLTWIKDKQEYSYDGPFNEKNLFHGKGLLKQPSGSYEGDFVNGEKQGKGIYHSANGTRYEGTYQAGLRHGTGTIYNGDNTIAYKGEMSKGLPHGKGSVFKNGKESETTWIEGIDSHMLPIPVTGKS